MGLPGGCGAKISMKTVKLRSICGCGAISMNVANISMNPVKPDHTVFPSAYL